MTKKIIPIATEAANEFVFGGDERELHTCPYREDIYDDHESLCDCDAEATHQCAMDI